MMLIFQGIPAVTLESATLATSATLFCLPFLFGTQTRRTDDEY
jgi:hypothetical protein